MKRGMEFVVLTLVVFVLIIRGLEFVSGDVNLALNGTPSGIWNSQGVITNINDNNKSNFIQSYCGGDGCAISLTGIINFSNPSPLIKNLTFNLYLSWGGSSHRWGGYANISLQYTNGSWHDLPRTWDTIPGNIRDWGWIPPDEINLTSSGTWSNVTIIKVYLYGLIGGHSSSVTLRLYEIEAWGCECSAGQEKCNNSNYLTCKDGCNWTNNGKVEGKCNVYSCSSSNDIIMKFYSPNNSHGALWDFPDYYYDICYSDIFGSVYAGASPHACTGGAIPDNKVLGLFQKNNSHAEIPSLDTYPIDVCYGDLKCTSVTGATPCPVNKNKTVVRLFQNTDSHISNESDTNAQIKICCGSAISTVSNLTGAYWANMTDEQISKADLNDRVKLMVSGTRIQNKEINYTIYKNVAWWFDKKMAQASVLGFTTWQANESGTYYFKATASDGSTNEITSGDLAVSALEYNSPPLAIITSPRIGEIYFTNELVLFEQESYDEDDFINYTWNLGDGNTRKGSTRDYVNYNFSYWYGSSGQMAIKLDVADERGLTDEDRTSTLVLDSGIGKERIYVFAHIDEPNWGEHIEGYNISFNASSSYAINTTNCNGVSCEIYCLGGGCPKIAYNGILVNDINNKRGDYSDLNFSWSFDDSVTYNREGINGTAFTKIFGKPGKHWAKLTVSINPESSTETEFTTSLKNTCQIDLESGKLIWWDDNGVPHDPREEQGYCQGKNNILGGGDDCCPSGYSCVDPDGGEASNSKCEVSTDDNCTKIVSCDDYKDEDNCEDDICGRAKLQTASACGGTVIAENICGSEYFTSRGDKCICEWNETEGKCTRKTNLWSTIYNNNPVVHTCESKTLHGECINGLMRIKVNSSVMWDEVYWNSLSLAERADLEQNCNLGDLCPNYEGVIVCGKSLVKLTFFSLRNLIIAILMIVIIYAIWILKKKERD